MKMKVLVTIRENDVAPRFDLTTEVMIVEIEKSALKGEPRIILLPGTSGEELCGLIVKEAISTVLCGAVEETHYQYLLWKKVRVIDGIIGPVEEALRRVVKNSLKPGDVLPEGDQTTINR